MEGGRSKGRVLRGEDGIGTARKQDSTVCADRRDLCGWDLQKV